MLTRYFFLQALILLAVNNNVAQVQVGDLRGKVLFRASEPATGLTVQVEINMMRSNTTGID